MGLIQTKGKLMWYLVQHDPNEIVALGSYDDYEKAKFVMINKQRFNSHCKYELIHSSELLFPKYGIQPSMI